VSRVIAGQRCVDARLTAKQKAYNYSVNRLRVAVERAVSRLKNWKILKTRYHRTTTDFPDVLRPARRKAGRPWPPRLLSQKGGGVAALSQSVMVPFGWV
jgi:hypothetical protein